MQKRKNILENDVQRCQKQSLDFELQLQHEKERRKCESSLKNVYETSCISKMEKLESENLRTRTQTQGEINELIENVKQKTYAYADVRAQNQDLLITISELKAKLENVEKTSPNKQQAVEPNKNVIAPRMYKVEKTQNTNTDKAKSVLSSIGLRDISSVRRPSNRDSSFKNSVLSNTKNSSEKVEVSDRSNKKSNVASKIVDSNKNIVTNDDIKNALIAKNVLCVSCAKNVIILCHDNCLAKYKLNVHLKVRRALFTTSRTVKSKFEDPTPVVSKTRFSVKTVQSKSLDTTPVVSKAKIVAVTPLSAKHKVSSAFKFRDSSLRNYMKNKIQTSRMWQKCVGQFYDGDLEVAFRSKTCFVRNLEGDDLLTRDREPNLYTISISDMAASSLVCLMSKATSTKSWLWHQRLSHLNFGTINDLTKHDLVDGLLKFKYSKDHLCSACKQGKSKKASHPPKLVPSNHSKLELLHMDLCAPMRVASINGKRYILVIVDDYSRFTWIRTDNGTEFKNATLKAHYDKLGIMQQFLIARTPQQNGVAEAVSTACFAQKRLIIHTRYNKTPYELLHGRKPNVEYFHMFGLLCYPTNDRDDLRKMKPKADIGIFIGYSKTSRGFQIYNRRTKKIMETIHVKFNELTVMASEHDSLEPVFQRFINDDSSAESMNIPSKEDLDNLFGPMYKEYFEKRSSETSINSAAQQVLNHEDSPSTSLIVIEEHEAPPIVTASEEQTSPISF
ncbi:retrovirus-related pol polyprotein from transposon TNT 1-94 [Tanacetum coccineum]